MEIYFSVPVTLPLFSGCYGLSNNMSLRTEHIDIRRYIATDKDKQNGEGERQCYMINIKL